MWYPRWTERCYILCAMWWLPHEVHWSAWKKPETLAGRSPACPKERRCSHLCPCWACTGNRSSCGPYQGGGDPLPSFHNQPLPLRELAHSAQCRHAEPWEGNLANCVHDTIRLTIAIYTTNMHCTDYQDVDIYAHFNHQIIELIYLFKRYSRFHTSHAFLYHLLMRQLQAA